MSRVVTGWAAALALSTLAAGCKKGEEPAPVEASGNTPCEMSYSAREKLARDVEKSGTSRKKLLPRDEYLTTCAALPEELQKCLVISYVMEHGDTCQAARDKLDAAGEEKFSKLVSGE